MVQDLPNTQVDAEVKPANKTVEDSQDIALNDSQSATSRVEGTSDSQALHSAATEDSDVKPLVEAVQEDEWAPVSKADKKKAKKEKKKGKNASVSEPEPELVPQPELDKAVPIDASAIQVASTSPAIQDELTSQRGLEQPPPPAVDHQDSAQAALEEPKTAD